MLIDEFHPGVIEELKTRLDKQAPNLFILVDGAFVPGLFRKFVNEIGDAKVKVLFKDLPGATSEVLDASPFLMHPQFLSMHLQELFNKCSGWPMVSLIESNEPFGTLAERLASWCIVASDGMRFNFRFADTRRLPALIETLNAVQLGSMFGSASGIRYVNRSGVWQYLKLLGQSQEITARPQSLSTQQFARLVDDGEVDIVLARLIELGRFTNWRRLDQFRHVANALKAAKVEDLSAEDTFAWCEASVDFELSSPTAAIENLAQWSGRLRDAI